MANTEELPPSELGTKQYWDSLYERELTNFKSHGDIGDIWFGEECVDRVVDWMLNSPHVSPEGPVLDIGCGNGAFLLYLAAEDFKNLVGIDYSARAVELARAVTAEKQFDIAYKVCDLTKHEDLTLGEFAVCHDKGTYDAVSLCPDDTLNNRIAYIKGVHQVTKEDGLFIITSCNWTHDELIQHFSDYFEKEHIIPTPSFMFGGKVGNKVSTVIFKKKS